MDLIADLAYPLPVTVIAELLGVPPIDHEVFQAWSAALVGSLDPIAATERSQRATSALEELRHYLAGIIARRRRAPQDDLISRLVAAEEQGDRLNSEELLQMGVLLLVAGHETTVNLIGNGVNALLEHPDQLDRLRRHPALIQSALEELLRFDSPVQMTHRVAMDDLPLGGNWIRAGQMVMAVLGAANRDPEAFPEPDRLDLARSPNHHVAFGQGIHYCLGAPLARAEGQIAIGRLVARFPTLRRDGEPRRRPNINLRGFESLPLAL
jgi:cytochrome P450